MNQTRAHRLRVKKERIDKALSVKNNDPDPRLDEMLDAIHVDETPDNAVKRAERTNAERQAIHNAACWNCGQKFHTDAKALFCSVACKKTNQWTAEKMDQLRQADFRQWQAILLAR